MVSLAGKVALITGAGRPGGLGEAIARRFARAGAHVVITDLRSAPGGHMSADNVGSLDGLNGVAEGIRRNAEQDGIEAGLTLLACDVRREADVAAVIERIIREFGRLDIAVNNAGVGFISKPLVDMTGDEWDLVLDVNLRGPFFVTKHAGKAMIDAIA
ncbi:MAG: SDR family oxidoreductase, partial [Rhodobacteraceae bacterium]|nr:SDR family oxidoreductase [Paracoccaceae bacterium]